MPARPSAARNTLRNTTRIVVALGLLPVAVAGAQEHHHHDRDSAVHSSGGIAETRSLAREIAALRKATVRYQEIREAQRDGYQRFAGGEAPLVGEHWYRKDLVDAPLDLSRPSTLMYATIAGERRLIGVAYTVYQRPGEPLPDGFSSTDDHWHVHDIPALAKTLSEDRPVLRWLVDRRLERGKVGPGEGRTQLVMVHAWAWLDNPDGMFALHHRALPYLQAGLPAEWAALPDANEAAARGLALLDPRACRREVRTTNGIAQLSLRQQNALRDACTTAAAKARTARSAVADTAASTGRSVNAAAAEAWRSYIGARDSLLTPEQRRRLESVVALHEH